MLHGCRLLLGQVLVGPCEDADDADTNADRETDPDLESVKHVSNNAEQNSRSTLSGQVCKVFRCKSEKKRT